MDDTDDTVYIVEKFVNYFKRKKKFIIEEIEEINNIINSQKYYDFINEIYNYYNSKVKSNSQIRLSPQCYTDAGQTIDYFWDLLLGHKLNNKFKAELKII